MSQIQKRSMIQKMHLFLHVAAVVITALPIPMNEFTIHLVITIIITVVVLVMQLLILLLLTYNINDSLPEQTHIRNNVVKFPTC